MLASSSSHRRLTIARPMPSPPCEGVGADCDPSRGAGSASADGSPAASACAPIACASSVATLSARASGGADPAGRPGPVSCTYSTQRAASSVGSGSQLTATLPRWVYRTALRIRFCAMRYVLTRSPSTGSGAVPEASSASPRSAASGRVPSHSSSSSAAASNAAVVRRSCPASRRASSIRSFSSACIEATPRWSVARICARASSGVPS